MKKFALRIWLHLWHECCWKHSKYGCIECLSADRARRDLLQDKLKRLQASPAQGRVVRMTHPPEQ